MSNSSSSLVPRRLWPASFLTAVSLLVALSSFAQTNPQSDNRTSASAPAATLGQWSTPANWGVEAIHLALLHTGKVLGFGYPQGDATFVPAMLLDPTTGDVKDVTLPFTGDFFCAAQSILSDGRVFVTGGLIGNPFPGVPDWGINQTAFFDPATEAWTAGPNMHYARWYPTSVEINDGTILEVTGKDENAHYEPINESYDPVANTWKVLPPPANVSAGHDTYLKLKLLPSGKVFNAGADAQTMVFSPSTNIWKPLGTMTFGTRYHGAAVLMPGNPNKVLALAGTQNYMGGGATNTAEVIDTSASDPQWVPVHAMNHARYNANFTILADGTVLAVGGATLSRYDGPVMTPEIYDPVGDTWTDMADQSAARPYHSTALLLADGRVISAGSDNPANYTYDKQYDIFSPPYLFKGPRPSITSVSTTSLGYNQAFTITTPQPTKVASVAMIRAGAVTHDNDMDQRYLTLTFTPGTGLLNVTTPVNASTAPPGWYMVVILSKQGVPSIAQWVQIGS